MPIRNPRKSRPLLALAAELAVATPQVVAHRMARMAMAGPQLSARDRKEFERMGAEKASAFSESWSAMSAQAMRAQQALGVSWLNAFWAPALKGRSSSRSLANQLADATLGVLDKGMAPIHRRAVANAKRLARTKVR